MPGIHTLVDMDANLIGLSTGVLEEYEKLDEAARRTVYIDYLRNRKDRDKGFRLSFLAGAHMLYLDQIGKFILFFLTVGGYGIWYIVEITTAREAVDKYNTRLMQRLVSGIIVQPERSTATGTNGMSNEEMIAFMRRLGQLRKDWIREFHRAPTEQEGNLLRADAQWWLENEYPSLREAEQERQRAERKAQVREQIDLNVKLVMGKCPRCFKPVSRIASKCPYCTAGTTGCG